MDLGGGHYYRDELFHLRNSSDTDTRAHLADARRDLDDCRARSLRHVVARGADACYAALVEAEGDDPQRVRRILRELSALAKSAPERPIAAISALLALSRSLARPICCG